MTEAWYQIIGFSQFLSDIINLNVVRPRVLETTALGVALFAGYQIGEFKSLNQIKLIWKKDRVFSPKLNKSLRNNLLQGWKVAIRKNFSIILNMKKILIIGAGAMGSAFTIPCADNNNEVTLVGTHLENELITSIKKNKNFTLH